MGDLGAAAHRFVASRLGRLGGRLFRADHSDRGVAAQDLGCGNESPWIERPLREPFLDEPARDPVGRQRRSLVPVPVTSTDALAGALEGGVEMALIRYAFEGGRGLAVLKTIYANDSTTTFNLYTDLRVDPKLLAQMKGKLLDENKLIADKGMFIAVSASRTFSKRADDRKLPKSGRAYSDHRQAEEAFEIRTALRAAGTVMEAARRLGIAEEELRERMKRHGIDAPS